MVATQTQGAATVTFTLDPNQNRILTSTDGSTATVDHYSDDSDSPAWTETGTDWTRNITGIDGGLAATNTQAGTVTLQLANPHGDIVATAADDPAATGVTSYSETTEYGTPRDPASANDTYGWLGTKQRSTDDLAGLTLMGVRLYNPATGRFLSVDPVPGGNANRYIYPDDPINGSDCGGDVSHYAKVIHLTTKQAKHWVSRLETGASIGELIAPAIGYVPFVGEILDIADQMGGFFAEDLAERIRVMNSKRGVDIQIKLTYVGWWYFAVPSRLGYVVNPEGFAEMASDRVHVLSSWPWNVQ